MGLCEQKRMRCSILSKLEYIPDSNVFLNIASYLTWSNQDTSFLDDLYLISGIRGGKNRIVSMFGQFKSG